MFPVQVFPPPLLVFDAKRKEEPPSTDISKDAVDAPPRVAVTISIMGLPVLFVYKVESARELVTSVHVWLLPKMFVALVALVAFVTVAEPMAVAISEPEAADNADVPFPLTIEPDVNEVAPVPP